MSTYNLAVDTSNCYIPYTWDQTSTTWNYWVYPQKEYVYLYQLICPRCETTNWGEVDKIVKCVGKGCKANLKAVSQVVDYEIPVK